MKSVGFWAVIYAVIFIRYGFPVLGFIFVIRSLKRWKSERIKREKGLGKPMG
jgi:hypothetical protein